MSILILGVGNILLSDEGIGVRVVEAFEKRYAVPEDVEIVDGGTAGMDLLDVIEYRDHVIVVDAVKTGRPPGTVVRLTGDDVQGFFRTKISPHQLGLSEVLAALSLLDASPGGVTIIGVEPLDFSTSLDLSPTIAAKLDAMVEMVAEDLTALGRPAERRSRALSSTTTRWP
ncbi:MAG: HyaD/HybD family hydrogenase maturation endopeptidase [Rhodospirillales bacterium]|nr:HyaD/HybD family hydrogenase maturation endopeptidase [Rhodospirillales bacterium]